MPNYIRAKCPGGTFFFAMVTYNRQQFLTTPVARKILKHTWVNIQHKWSFYLDAVCLLPDHFHCIITIPEDDWNYALRWRAIKGQFSRQYRKLVNIDDIPQSLSRHKRGNLPIWQHRYWEHQIRDEEDFIRHVEYIHYNPVKHGLVNRAIDYPWSTFRQYVRKGLYEKEWGIGDEDLRDLGEVGE